MGLAFDFNKRSVQFQSKTKPFVYSSVQSHHHTYSQNVTKKIAGCVFVTSNQPISKFFTSQRKVTISCDKNIKYNLKGERVELGEITCVTSEGVTL